MDRGRRHFHSGRISNPRMKRTEPRQLGDILREAIESAGLTDELARQRACFVWADVVGAGVNRYTFRRYVAGSVMHVYITSAVLKNELSFCRSSLVEKINKAVGSDVLTEIVFH